MGTYFWHHATTKTVYKLSVWATEKLTKHKPPRYDGCHVSGDLTWLSAKWTNDPDQGWIHQGGRSPHKGYDQRDSPERAESFFAPHQRPEGAVDISAAEYNALRAVYLATAKATKPKTGPAPGSPAIQKRRS